MSKVVAGNGLDENIKQVLKDRKEKDDARNEEELDPELLYDGEYTELKLSKQTLKWRIARLNSSLGMNAFLIYSFETC